MSFIFVKKVFSRKFIQIVWIFIEKEIRFEII